MRSRRLLQSSLILALAGLLAASPAQAWSASGGGYDGKDSSIPGTLDPRFAFNGAWSTIDISATGTPFTAADSYGGFQHWTGALPVGFTFDWFGVPTSSVRYDGDGLLYFGTAPTPDLPFQAVPMNDGDMIDNVVAVWYTDSSNGGCAGVQRHYQTVGTTGQRTFILQVTGVQMHNGGACNQPTAGTAIDFQVRIYEESSAIEVHYLRATNQDPYGGDALVVGMRGNGAAQTIQYLYQASGGIRTLNNVVVQYRPSGEYPVPVNDGYTHNWLVDGPTLTVPAVSGLLVNDRAIGAAPMEAVLDTSSVPAGIIVRDLGGVANQVSPDGGFQFETLAVNPCTNSPYTFRYRLLDAWSEDPANLGNLDPAQLANLPTGTVTMTVTNCNLTPTVPSQTLSTAEDTPRTIALGASDGDNDPLTYTILDAPDFGTLSGWPSTAQTAPVTVTYHPAPDTYNRNGAELDQFTFLVDDGRDGLATATVTIDRTPVNDPPVLTLQDVSTLEDQAGTFAAADFITGMLPAASATARSHDESAQSLSLAIVTPCDAAFFLACPTLGAGNGLTYTPHPDVNGVRTITLRLTDSGTHLYTSTPLAPAPQSVDAALAIRVTAVNDAPLLTLAPLDGVEDQPTASAAWLASVAAGPATAADEADQALTWTVLTPCDASFFLICPSIDSATRVLTFQPVADGFGTRTLQVRVQDDGTDDGTDDDPAATTREATADLTVTVQPVNDAPTATPGATVTVAEDSASAGQAVRTHVLSGWTTPTTGPANEGQSIVSITPSGFAPALFATPPTLDATGTLRFVLAPDAFGTTSGTFRITDSGPHGGLDVNRLDVPATIVVQPVNDPPVAMDDVVADLYPLIPDQAVLPSVLLANDADVEGSALSVVPASVAAVTGGTARFEGGAVLFTPADGHLGPASFTYRVTDGAAASAPATVAFDIVDPPDFVFMIQPREGRVCAGDTVTLRAIAFGGGRTTVQWSWLPGDGGPVQVTNVSARHHVFSHAYAAPGTYRVELSIVIDGFGADGEPLGSDGTFQDVVVDSCLPPTALFTTRVDGLSVRFLDGSNDAAGSVVAAAWTFGDGATSSAREPTHVFAAPGVYRVTLTVTDNEGDAATVSRDVAVGLVGGGGGALPPADAEEAPSQPAATTPETDPVNRAPEARVAAPARLDPAAPGLLDASASRDADGNPLTYQWSQVSGPAVVLVGEGPRAAFVAPAQGTLVFRVRVSDGMATDARDVTVLVEAADDAPAAGVSFHAEPAGALALAFEAPGAADALRLDWDFGDGATGSGVEPVHQYAAPGTYTVRLRATTAAGVQESVQTVTVAAGTPDAEGPAELHETTPAAATGMPAAAWVGLSVVGAGLLVALGTVATVWLARRR